jgi:hypothetical protein
MIDPLTKKRVTVSPAEGGGGDFHIRYDRLKEVLALLEHYGVPHWPREHYMSINGEPPVIFITLGYKADPQFVQELLDQLP